VKEESFICKLQRTPGQTTDAAAPLVDPENTGHDAVGPPLASSFNIRAGFRASACRIMTKAGTATLQPAVSVQLTVRHKRPSFNAETKESRS